MRYAFYDSPAYKEKQRQITKRNTEDGLYEHLKKSTARTCLRKGCSNTFTVKSSNRKKYCGSSCAARVNNLKRVQSESTRKKVASSLCGRPNPYKGSVLVPRLEAVCANLNCKKKFTYEQHISRKYCSASCAIRTVGSRPTSAKASRGKSGIRADISKTISFHSRWEANIARLYTYLGVVWEYEPRTFDIGGQNYTPDFYLLDTNEYLEVKNFWHPYSKERDRKFRLAYPDIKLRVLLKEEYTKLENQYGKIVSHWEFKRTRR